MQNKLLFIDESGSNNITKPDAMFPIFLLTGICIDEKNYVILEESISELKHKFFGSDVILHVADINKNIKGFEKLQDAVFRNQFYNELERIIINAEFDVFNILIDSANLSEQTVPMLSNPYIYCIDYLAEAFISTLGNATGKIIIETGDKALSAKIWAAVENVKSSGTSKVSKKRIAKNIQSFELKVKKDNSVGLQIADLIANYIARSFLKMPLKLAEKMLKGKKISTKIITGLEPLRRSNP